MNALPLRLFVHVEEPSAKEVIEALLPKLIGPRQLDTRIIEHGGKASLLTNLPNRLRGYAAMPAEDIRVMVLVDRDRDECHALKARLEETARAAGLPTKANPTASGRFRVVNRIAIEELEAWFIGDLAALRTVFPRLPFSLGQKVPFRDPDAVPGGTWEALHRALQRAGSASFRAFVGGIEALISASGGNPSR
jgi:hypothetical protein